MSADNKPLDADATSPNGSVLSWDGGLGLLRQPFPAHQISKLPKGTKAQNECGRELKRKCQVCGGFHHPDIIHLDYVGHAALTDRLLDADPAWSWEPLAVSAEGLPQFDKSGGLWIKLTVCGVTRIGYGNAEAKAYMDVGSREKEAIGDALRNAAMRFGAALDLWHKGQLHIEEDPPKVPRGSAKESLQDAFDALSPAEQESLRNTAQRINEVYAAKGIADAVDDLHSLTLDAEGKMALWFLLDSTIRSSIKREETRRRALIPEEV
jgi:hypothetical protein